jgi:pimeloyl-ACP methyl ester carboxylesterase
MASLQYATSPDGTRIAYRTWGEGEPLVLVHGSGTSGADWLMVRDFLRERFRVVVMDRRGRGASTDHPDYTIDREAEDILAVLDATGGSLVVAHSYGALCTIRAVQRTDSVRRVCLYEPPISLDESDITPFEELVDSGRAEDALWGFLSAVGTTPEQRDAIRTSPVWPDLVDVVATLPRELHAIADWTHPREELPVETLFLRGADTTAHTYLDTFDDLRAAFPHSRLETLPNQQHVAHVFAPEGFARQITDFFA